MRKTLLSLLSFLLASCGHGGAAGEPATAPASAAPAPMVGGAPDLPNHMQASFWEAVLGRDAVIAGDLTQARERFGRLSQERFEQLPERWKHWVAQMQKNAGNAAVAVDIDETAQWTATLALSCGDCHEYAGAGPKFGVQHGEEATPVPEDVRERMLRHAHAADDLWTGLVMPSDAAWRRGARKLNEAEPLPPVQQDETVNAAFAEQLNQVKALGLRAQTARTPPERATVYAELLARCARCHAITTR